MYYIVYAFLYLLSLLPFFIWYPISTSIAAILRKMKYRKEVILYNLRTAFPQKTEEEIQAICRQFYIRFTDSMVDMLKLMSMSKKELQKRAFMDVSSMLPYLQEGRQIIIMASHLFGWEYGNSVIATKITRKFVGVYMKMSSDTFDRVVKTLRSRTGALLLSAHEFPKQSPAIFGRKEVLGLIADQNPAYIDSAYWLHFFSKPVPFNSAPEKAAQRTNAVVFFMQAARKKRGYYSFTNIPITTEAAATANGDITRAYRKILEESVLQQPANYLWSHKRYKWTREQVREKRWMDDRPLPAKNLL